VATLLWLRRDLRVHDNPALRAALDRSDGLVPVFCFDDRLLHGRHASGPRTQFMLEALSDLDRSLRERGSRLVVRRGRPERELPLLARELGAEAAFMSSDVSPFARRRDRAASAALAEAGCELRAEGGLFAVDRLESISTGAGNPYTVFTPFHRSWLERPRRAVLPAPRALPPLPAGLDAGVLPTLADLGLHEVVPEPARGGERAGRKAMRAFLSDPVAGYGEGRDLPGRERSSRLSPYLHFGCISPRELEHRLPPGEGGREFRRQLGWRDFFAHVMFHFPRNARSEHQERYRATIRWSHAHRRFEAWQEGRTGYPLVDAGMRQLRCEGWMHNRARLVVGSFLTKDLGIDWRWGERWFMRLLLDGDEASNNGNWQWIASVGVDPQPPFRRILSPSRQQQRFDADGRYVRRYVEELGEVPDRYLHEPSRMPDDVQRQAGCVIGRDYPRPIVDHAAARREALERYRGPPDT
jgi:deoxyribodipyrimidine photo-lyase